MSLNKNKIASEVVNVFYACDEEFVNYAIVSIKSLIMNRSTNRRYEIHLLNTGISYKSQEDLKSLVEDGVDIEIVDVNLLANKLGDKLPIRDYYSKSTYYRLFIATLYPNLNKALYVDSDTVILGDVSQLYDTNLDNYYIGACHEEVMLQTDVYGNYVEKALGIDRNNYFNAGVILINCKAFRDNKILEKFYDLSKQFAFVITQDQDYLNVLAKDKVLFLDSAWNVEVYNEIKVKREQMKIVHYVMASKPWLYDDCALKEIFWEYASNTKVLDSIKNTLKNYKEEKKENDRACALRLMQTAKEESERIDSYKNASEGKSLERLKVLERVRKLEKQGAFDVDADENPKTIVLEPNKVDYLNKKMSSRIGTKIANVVATSYYEKEIKKGNFIIKEIKGIENYLSVEGGLIITCNHFSVYDNYAVWRAIKPYFKKGKKLYKVIREGNYTNFKGLYGYFFRHCNTLPLSSNSQTMKKFLTAIKTLLNRGEKILIYPEQALWWNYKKPRPLKIGAFKLASKNNVPVLPCFITMEESNKTDANGFDIPKYTVWFLPVIYPKENLGVKENAEYMKEENYRAWKELYEKVYGVSLNYGEMV